jgi:hypothetical protein
MTEGGVVGPHFLRFECSRPGRPARLSRAFGVDGKTYEAMNLGLWVRVEQIQTGERVYEEPGLLIDFLGPKLHQLSRGTLGPWNAKTFAGHGGWTRVVKRIPIPPGTLDAIMSVGLLGATGVLDIDGLTIELIPCGETLTTNLVKNPGFELGDPDAAGWSSENGARRGFPGHRSSAALELSRRDARCLTPLALPVAPFTTLEVRVMAAGKNLRGSGGASAALYFLNGAGGVLPNSGEGPVFTWSGSFEWRESHRLVDVPRGAVHAVLQFEKSDQGGSIRIDEVSVAAAPDASLASWSPYHVDDDTERWLPVAPSSKIEPGSALDFSFLLDGPAGKKGTVVVKDGRLAFSRTGRARFFGVHLLAPTAFLEPKRADALADRLARSGVNLVRLGDLDTPLGPGRCLFDDTRDDTAVLDANALARLDHLIDALKRRGIYVALELQSARRFRVDDGVAMPGALPPGGGPASLFDPTMIKLATESAKALLTHVSSETGRALKDEPALAWVTLAGEVSLFDLADNPYALSGDYAAAYRALASKAPPGDRKRWWQTLEAAQRREEADAIRKVGLKAPVASVAHWRREKEFSEAVGGEGFDLIDDRVFWPLPPLVAPEVRSMLWSPAGGLLFEAIQKRRPDRPYVLGEWCDLTFGTWASPYEAAEQLLAAETAASQDWDAIVRRGVFVHPEAWGSGAAGTGGGEDIFQLPEVANAAPQVFALWPHAASLMLRGHDSAKEKERAKAEQAHRTTSGRSKRHGVPGWEPERGRLVLDSPYTQGVAGWIGDQVIDLDHLSFDLDGTYGVLVASSASREPIATTKRLLVTAIARISPTGFAYVDPWKRETADPGRPPLLQEPVVGKVRWKRSGAGTIKAYALDNTGARTGEAKVVKTDEGTVLVIEGTSPTLHWELVVE